MEYEILDDYWSSLSNDMKAQYRKIIQEEADRLHTKVLLMKDRTMKRRRKDGRIVMMNCQPVRYGDGREPVFADTDIIEVFEPRGI